MADDPEGTGSCQWWRMRCWSYPAHDLSLIAGHQRGLFHLATDPEPFE